MNDDDSQMTNSYANVLTNIIPSSKASLAAADDPGALSQNPIKIAMADARSQLPEPGFRIGRKACRSPRLARATSPDEQVIELRYSVVVRKEQSKEQKVFSIDDFVTSTSVQVHGAKTIRDRG